MISHEPELFHGRKAGTGEERFGQRDGDAPLRPRPADFTAGELLQKGVIADGALRKAHQILLRTGHGTFQGGQHLMADAIARIGDVRIALVLHIGQGVFADVFVDRLPRHAEQRPQEPLLHGKDPEPLQRRPAGKAEEHGLGIVVAVMGGEHGIGPILQDAGKTFTAKEPPLLFEVAAALPRTGRHIGTEHGKRDAPALTQVPHKGDIGSARGADAVIAGERRERDVRLLCVPMQKVKERNGIPAARNGRAEGKSPIGSEGKELHIETV